MKQFSLYKNDEFFKKKKKKTKNLSFNLNHPLTRHLKFKVIDFAPSKVKTRASKLATQLGDFISMTTAYICVSKKN